MSTLKNYLIALSCIFWLASCQAPGKNSPGSEYMPDMAHSIAYEANVYNYYYNHTWGGEDEYYAFAKPRVGVNGTVPRTTTNNQPGNGFISIPSTGSVPYPYVDTEEDRARAIAEIIKNPYPISAKGLGKGKELYEIFCATCHGEKADGGGYLVRDDGGKYPAQPANLLLEEHVNASNGRYYHVLMHGKNLMASYKDKINFEERWQVIHYIRSLQAAELKKEYTEKANTLNSVDVPAATIVAQAAVNEVDKATEKIKGEEAHGSDKNHGEKH